MWRFDDALEATLFTIGHKVTTKCVEMQFVDLDFTLDLNTWETHLKLRRFREYLMPVVI